MKKDIHLGKLFIVHFISEKALEEMQMKLHGNYCKNICIEQEDLFEWERRLNWNFSSSIF